VRKPGISARTSYSPGSSAGALKMPDALAVTLRVPPVVLWVMLIAALAITAPDSSVTVPEMMPVGVCAETVIPVKTNANTSKVDKEIALHMAISLLSDETSKDVHR
jgi:hypothetical protein